MAPSSQPIEPAPPSAADSVDDARGHSSTVDWTGLPDAVRTRLAEHYLELVSRRASDATLRAERDAAVAKAERLEADLRRVQGELDAAQGVADRVRAEGEAELERLRKKLREQGVRLREARDEAE